MGKRIRVLTLISLRALCVLCGLLPTIQMQSVPINCFPSRPIPIDRWRGEYFNNTELSGAPIVVRDDTQAGSRFLEFNWKLDSPSKDCGLAPDNFSVRWTRTIALAKGSYRFTVAADDGVRLLIDGQIKLDQWRDQTLATYSVDVLLASGNHKIELEYYERWGSAAVSLSWEPHPCIATVAPDRWRGEYFNNDSLGGEPLMVRDDGANWLAFDFHEEGPSAVCGITQTFYSARWNGKAAFNAGVYRFSAISDGGMRVYVDGQLRLDEWRSNTTAVSDFDLLMTPGNHELVFEYRRKSARSRGGLSWTLVPCRETVPSDHWRGEYFNSDNLSGDAVMVRDDGERQLDFNWAELSAGEACGVRRDSFSIRWTREVFFTAGVYRFIVAGNDALRFYVDGQLKLDQWREQSASFLSDVELTAGRHQLKLEYADFGGKASVKLTWQPPPCITAVPVGHWRGEYFTDTELEGRPVVVRDEGDGRLNFDWGLDKPHPDCFHLSDNFSARWTRTATFSAGLYRFHLTADDGVRVFIDGQLKFDRWQEQMLTDSFDVPLTAGTHQLRVEYFDRWGSAVLKFRWERNQCFADVPTDRWRGEYFNNTGLTGQPQMIRDEGDGVLNFDWNSKSAGQDCGVQADDFSVRWTRRVILPAGVYRFTATSDDGVRLWVDGKKLLDEWREQPPTNFISEAFLTAGNHRIVLEYFDRAGGATAKLAWQKIEIKKR